MCVRCKKQPVAPPKVFKNGKQQQLKRCLACLAYAANWQYKTVELRRENKKCITCGDSDKDTRKGYSKCLKCREKDPRTAEATKRGPYKKTAA